MDKESDEQAPVLTLFFRGTGQHRETSRRTLIDQFTDEATPDPQHSVYEFDGIGSKPANKASQHPTPGTYTFDPENGKKIPHTQQPPSNLAWTLFAKAFGAGVESLVAEAYQVIEQLEDSDKKPGVINITGFSRGAYTSILTAQMIRRLYPDIRVNLFLIDPVPGLGRKSDLDALLIPSNVDNCTIVLQKDEDGSAFEVLDKSRLRLEDPQKTCMVYETLPGQHAAGLKVELDSSETQAAPKVVGALLYAFLTRHGTAFSKAPNYAARKRNTDTQRVDSIPGDTIDTAILTNTELLQLYQDMQQHQSAYKGKGRSSIPRDFLAHREDYVLDGEFFVTQRHRELFKDILPKTFDYRFQQMLEADGKSSENYQHEIQIELRALKASYPALYKSLKPSLEQMGFVWNTEKKAFDIPAHPQGHHQIETSPVLNNTPPGDTPLNLLNYKIDSALQEAQRGGRINRACAQALKAAAEQINTSDHTDWNKIHTLKRAVARARQVSQKEDDPFSMRLSVILHPSEQLAYDLIDLFEHHLANNTELKSNEALCGILKEGITEIKNLLKNEKLSSKQKLSQGRDIVDGVTLFASTFHPHGAAPLVQDITALRTQPHAHQRYIDQLINKTNRYLIKNRLRQGFQTVIAKLRDDSIEDKTGLSKNKYSLMTQFTAEVTTLKSQPAHDSEQLLKIVEKYLQDAKNMERMWGKKHSGSSVQLLQQVKHDLAGTGAADTAARTASSTDFTPLPVFR